MTWIIWLGLALVAIAIGTIGLAAYGAARWADLTKRLVLRLEGTRLSAATSRYDAHELDATRNWLSGKAQSIYGGSNEIQNNIIAKRILGLLDHQ